MSSLTKKDMIIADRFGVRSPKGEIGIEIEMEGNNLPVHIDKYWHVKNDGSLRGEAREYVLVNPITRGKVNEALSFLHSAFIESQALLEPSNRCGVHVHLNFTRNIMSDLLKFGILYYILEPALVRYCGADRVGNHFCLRLIDSDPLVHAFSRLYGRGEYHYDDSFRYAALNLGALARYGSIEIRCGKTPKDVRDIANWIDIVTTLRDASEKYDTPAEIIETMSGTGAERFLENVMQDKAELLMYPDFEEEVFYSLRQIQIAVYSNLHKKKKKNQKID